MTAKVIKGTKQQIAEEVARMEGEVREAIIFIAEPADTQPPAGGSDEDMFAEMEPYMVEVGDADDSRDAIYTRQEGE